jgi:succinyl-CoA synthetase alpha subunit
MIVRGGETVLVQGITSEQASFWAAHMCAYGTRIIGGVSPKKGGTTHLGVPVWASAREAAGAAAIDVSVLFVPPLAAKAAVLDAIEAGIGKIVVLAEHIPLQDTMFFLATAREAGARIVGPNTAGVVTPGECFVGFMPAFNGRVFRPGAVGVISRSGSLGTLACLELVRAGFGVSAFIGIGGDPIVGTTIVEALKILDQDERTEAVVIIGEIGGSMEEAAAETARSMTKPIAAFIAGAAAPPGRRMGHAGAIVMGERGTYAAKKAALEDAGVAVVPVPSQLADGLRARWR